MKLVHSLLLSVCASVLSLLFYSWYHQLLIVAYIPYCQAYISTPMAKTKATLYYWTHNKWVSETIELPSCQTIQLLTIITNKWCSLIYEEHCCTKQFNIAHILLTASGKELYINFNRKPFDKKQSTFEKWVLIEGLLKTISSINPAITQIHFLVNHTILLDEHLDFSKPWPIYGFKG